MQLRTGIDMIEIERVKNAIQRHGLHFLNRVFTERELHEVGDNPGSLAARWAAKEAVAKAFCTGIGPMRFKDIEILRGASREPILKLSGQAAVIAREQNLTSWSVSLSHSKSLAIAMVVATGE
jgi:holo-[acyl-carrier protein] synthase